MSAPCTMCMPCQTPSYGQMLDCTTLLRLLNGRITQRSPPRYNPWVPRRTPAMRRRLPSTPSVACTADARSNVNLLLAVYAQPEAFVADGCHNLQGGDAAAPGGRSGATTRRAAKRKASAADDAGGEVSSEPPKRRRGRPRKQVPLLESRKVHMRRHSAI